MRNIISIAFLLLVVSCKKEAKKVSEQEVTKELVQESEQNLNQDVEGIVAFSGKIIKKNSDKITVLNSKTGYKKEFLVAEDGTFKDTLKIKTGFYTIFDGAEQAQVYFEAGDSISMTLDTKQFDETIKFSGKGSEESNFLTQFSLSQELFFGDKGIMALPKEAYNKKVNTYFGDFKTKLTANEANFNPSFVVSQKSAMEQLKKYAESAYEENSYLVKVLAKGKTAPKFSGYENIKGGKTSLDDLKGKFLYIDVWATWCKPCKDEIPALKKLTEEFKGKNIEFVSISVDDKRDYETWKAMIAEKQMGGVQLYSGKDMKFMNDYRISSIPRFIIIDPKGNFVESNAPRPSQPETSKLLKSLL